MPEDHTRFSATRGKRTKKEQLEKEGEKNKLSQKEGVKIKGINRGKKVKKPRTEKQAFILNKDVTVHLWEDRWVIAEHRLQGMEE